MSLDQCLQHFISSETIKEVECENCTKVPSLQSLNHFIVTVIVVNVKLTKKQPDERKKNPADS